MTASGKLKYYVGWQPKFPIKGIEKFWNAGRNLQEISYANNRWVVVATKRVKGSKSKANSNKEREQALHTCYHFPVSIVKKAWNDDCKVRSLSYCNDMWVVMTEEHDDTVDQSIIVKPQFPLEQIEEEWKMKKRVTSLAYGNSRWVVISEPMEDERRKQQVIVSHQFPIKKVIDGYAKNEIVHCLVYSQNERLWVVIMEPNLDCVHQVVHKSEEFPGSKISNWCSKKSQYIQL
eukprot:TRINITY_DN8356_c0_g1_i2.p1 TRINITY_DN8356_c0_g1~~TRINITY_DN8356_c0_g1_i2.p1  ORF type:complete len:233 (+),score=31.27 TRINITY_DN8356_c0_g1_i2:405-1103(+)